MEDIVSRCTGLFSGVFIMTSSLKYTLFSNLAYLCAFFIEFSHYWKEKGKAYARKYSVFLWKGTSKWSYVSSYLVCLRIKITNTNACSTLSQLSSPALNTGLKYSLNFI